MARSKELTMSALLNVTAGEIQLPCARLRLTEGRVQNVADITAAKAV